MSTENGMKRAGPIESAVFQAALDLDDAAERRQFLERACAGDEDLRARVEELLSSHEEAERLFAKGSSALRRIELAGQADTQPGRTTRPERSPAREQSVHIGRYKLLEKVGEGGCGDVYMAEQSEPVRRRVALKIIKLGMDTKNVIARFEAERQALALMDHPNIARVLDAGATDTGRPYFVMELVRGVKITEYCDQNNLDTRRRLELFVQICNAIQHAHQKGIIHRDIKPSNILVTLHDGIPVPKVIDFGIAKAMDVPLTDKTLFTSYEQFIGTPAYVSPEQAEMSGLDVDTRSDIYSLGVLLYELLTGRTPFDGKSLTANGIEQLRKMLREKEPQRPSTMVTTFQDEDLKRTAVHRHVDPPKLISLLRGDLDWIVMKALEKDRTLRYATANAMVEDIQRYLNNEPVTARPPSRFYLFRKLVRRNKVVFAAGGAVVAALTIGLGTSTWLYLKEFRLRRDAEYRERITQASYLVALGRLDEADRVVGSVFPAPPSLDSESVLRTLGIWHAVRGNWPRAAEYLSELIRADRNNNPDRIAADIMIEAPVLIELGDRNRYEQFRQHAVARFLNVNSPIATERVIKSCLLLPAGPDTMRSLSGLAAVAEKSLTSNDPSADDFLSSWRCVSVGLMEYRRGNFRQAEDWCRRCLQSREKVPARMAGAEVILAMALAALNDETEARIKLAQAAVSIEAKFERGLVEGNDQEGYWHDWLFARILLREAQELMGVKPPLTPLTAGAERL